MLKNYIKIAWRSILNNKVFSLINVLGLSMGVTCSLLIALWVMDEYNTDAFHEDGDRIYAMYERRFYDGKIDAGYYTPGLLPEEIKRVLPNVEYATGLSWNSYQTFSAKEKSMKFEGTYSGEDFFQIFSFPLIQGSKEDALNSPDAIAISRTMANSFFDNPETAIGQSVKFENEKDLTIKAVFDVPSHASRKFDYLLNWDLFLENHPWANDWGNNGPQTYIKLRAGTDPTKFESGVTTFLDNYNMSQSDQFRIELGMQKFSDMYLHSRFKNGEIDGGKIDYVRLFSIVAVFILLIACINFMNLTTAQSSGRAKEIGVRKVIGAFRTGLIRQFISEAFLITLFSVIIALLFTIILLPVFNDLTGKDIRLPYGDLTFWIGLLSMTVITSFAAGSYPAFMLSSFRPVTTLKGGKNPTSGSAFLRKGLVTFQFMMSILFVAATMVISRQIDYIQNTNIGYEKENLLYIPLDGKLFTDFDVFKEEAGKIPGIESISRISQRPVELDNRTGGVEWDGKDPEIVTMFSHVSVGYDFIKNMKVEILEGRDFSKEFGSDSLGYLINESALAKIGYENPVGKRLTFWGNDGTIIGVVKDFHVNSLHVPVEPLIIRLGVRDDFSYALIRTGKGQSGQVLRGLESLVTRLNPGFPFAYQFADQEYALMYSNEYTIQRLSGYFTFLAIFISCLGLLGLAMYTAEQRTKEIGIRKVLGASVESLFTLLSKEYLILMAIAFCIAIPVALWSIDNWLQNFTYHVGIEWWIFLIAGLSVIFIALATVSFQVIKVSITNPTETLKSE